jgi:hypothetical protein
MDVRDYEVGASTLDLASGSRNGSSRALAFLVSTRSVLMIAKMTYHHLAYRVQHGLPAPTKELMEMHIYHRTSQEEMRLLTCPSQTPFRPLPLNDQHTHLVHITACNTHPQRYHTSRLAHVPIHHRLDSAPRLHNPARKPHSNHSHPQSQHPPLPFQVSAAAAAPPPGPIPIVFRQNCTGSPAAADARSQLGVGNNREVKHGWVEYWVWWYLGLGRGWSMRRISM